MEVLIRGKRFGGFERFGGFDQGEEVWRLIRGKRYGGFDQGEEVYGDGGFDQGEDHRSSYVNLWYTTHISGSQLLEMDPGFEMGGGGGAPEYSHF